MTLGESIRNARMAKGLTQKQLAELIGSKNNSVSNWEHGTHKPDIDTLERLCKVLDISPVELLGAEYPAERIGRLTGAVISDAEMIRFLNEYYQLDADEKNAIKLIVSRLCTKKGDVKRPRPSKMVLTV